MTALDDLGAFVATARFDENLRQLARLHAIDVIGAWIAGRATPEGRALIAYSTGGDGLDRLAANCGLARLSEIDDIHLASLTTPGAAIVPAALTVAAAGIGAGAGPEPGRADLLDAIIVGYEAMVRLGAALGGPAILYRGIWPSYFTAPFGVAAVAARLQRLTAAQATQALALALHLAAPSVGHQGGPTTSRWLAFGLAARNGAVAARAAQAGFTADRGLLESAVFPSVYAIKPDLPALTEGLGERPVLPGVSFKPWCAARQTMAATQALMEMMTDGLRPVDIVEIAVSIPGLQTKMVDHGVTAGDRMSHLTSLPYQMAVAALAPDAAYDIAQAPPQLSEDLRAFMAKITVRADDGLLSYYPQAWPARVVARTRADSSERLVTQTPGDPARPFDMTAVTRKFSRIVAPIAGTAAAEAWLGGICAALDGTGRLATLLDTIDGSSRA